MAIAVDSKILSINNRQSTGTNTDGFYIFGDEESLESEIKFKYNTYFLNRIVLSIVLVISTDKTFSQSNVVYSPRVTTYWGANAENFHIALAKKVIAEDGITIEQQSNVVVPKNILRSNTKYYCRFQYDSVETIIGDTTVGTGFRGPEQVDSYRAEFKTISNRPKVEFKADSKYKMEGTDNRYLLPEFGSVVTLEWVTEKANSVNIKPTTYSEYANAGLSGKVNIDINEDTQFVLTATNENGDTVVTLNVSVTVPEGVIPIFIDKIPFPVSEIRDGTLVAKIGESFDLQLLPEYMQDIQLFIAYPYGEPLRDTQFGSIAKKIVNPPDLMKNLSDESTQGVIVKVPSPGKPLPINTAVSGAWGYDAKGKDGKTHRVVSGYFILMEG